MGFWRGDLTHQPLQGITGIHSAPPLLTHCGSKIPSPSLVWCFRTHTCGYRALGMAGVALGTSFASQYCWAICTGYTLLVLPGLMTGKITSPFLCLVSSRSSFCSS